MFFCLLLLLFLFTKLWRNRSHSSVGTNIAQWVQSWAENPRGANTDAGSSTRGGKSLSLAFSLPPPASAFSADSWCLYSPSPHPHPPHPPPVSDHMRRHLCARNNKIPNAGSRTTVLFGDTKILHTPVGMDSAALRTTGKRLMVYT